ncbi:MAG: tRNA lysidine(34) synthetase TilS [Bacteroidales bacterium]|nr:tRNA lysidine(34) synthetase TilS [Bacteroidales bacterium]
MLLSRFQSQIDELIPRGGRLLLAVSGGRDSVVLADLCRRAGLCYDMAHCNFHLRPGDCDRDEQFVRALAQQQGVPCWVAQFDTQAYATDQHLSIEDAARRLRYDFFEQVRLQQGLDYIVTAHHRDDSIETFFLNLLRGTGIAGLHGIRPMNGTVIRPMLIFGRDEIDTYVRHRNLSYVEDASNASLQYRRNQIRHQLMPMLRQLAPSFDASMQQTMSYLSDVETVYKDAVTGLRQHLFHRVGERSAMDSSASMVGAGDDSEVIEIPIDQVRLLHPRRTLMYELLGPYGFSLTQIENLLDGLNALSGQRYLSPTHLIVKDRYKILLASRNWVETPPPSLSERIILPPADLAVIREWSNARKAYFDADKLAMPLSVRHWHEGDRFYPFGMKGSQLLSDYFSNNKYSLIDKQCQWLLVDAEDRILWIIGRRTDRRAQVMSDTHHVLEVSF